jgi:hypothetical protein
MFSLLFLLHDRRIREAPKHKDPTDPDLDSDPDPQHCFRVIIYIYNVCINVLCGKIIRKCAL